MRVLREIVVQRTDVNELLAVSHLPAVIGEEMTLDVMAGGATVGVRVRVIESRPVIVDGSVRHRIRLGVVDAAASKESEELAGAGEPGAAFLDGAAAAEAY